MRKQFKFVGLFVGLVLCSIFLIASCGQQGSQTSKEDIQAMVDEATKGNVRMSLIKDSAIQKILKRGELRVGFESGYVPFEMTNKKGDYIGFDMDFGKRLAKAMGVKFVPVNTAWDGIIPALTTDKFDIIMGGMTITQERNLKIAFANPYIVVGQSILLNKKHADTVKSYKDLNNKKYLVTSRVGTTGEKAIKTYLPNATYKGYEAESDAAMEVINGKADALIYDLPFCGYMYAAQGKATTVFLNEPFTFEPLAWAINQGDPDFLNYLNNFLRQTKGDGFYEKTYNYWIAGSDWKKDVGE
ncbi:MAG: transporter substrate-binding domain-containing protein [Deltaproteobacteria bacterium]|nr:transporter substrate-binding domain-containing protein [Deltaproteobacteria bacterium]